MSEPETPDIEAAQVDKIRRVVERDHNRVTDADEPWSVLGLERGAGAAEINQRFERYEQFYRAENFKRFDDNDLTRKALEIRKMISRAVVELQAAREGGGSNDIDSPALESIDPDSQALAEIYFRDGITWMKLEDLDSAVDCFQRSMDHDPSKGVTLAYHAFARYQRNSEDAEVVAECRESFRTASIIGSDNPEIHVLQARFALETNNPGMAKEGIDNLRAVEPSHESIGELRRLYDEMTK